MGEAGNTRESAITHDRKVTTPRNPPPQPPPRPPDAEVDLHLADGEYFLGARLNVSLPGVDHEVARTLVKEAHEICPYSKATRGNIEVEINLV